MRAWLLAARPPTLFAATAPVLVGSGLAASEGVFRSDAFAATLAAAVLINLAANFANDASDAQRGVDGSDRIGPPRAVAAGLITPRAMWTATSIAVVAAAALGVYLAAISSWVVVALGAAAIVAMLGYTGGPWPYGYHGLGEISVFVFFGLAAVVGSRFVHDTTVPAEAWLLAVPVGFLATAILVANNIRDIDGDAAAGKRTLAVMMGRTPTQWVYTGLVLGAFAVIGVVGAIEAVPLGCLLALAALPLAWRPITIVATRTDGPSLIGALKATARVHLLVGILLGAGAQL